VRRATHSAWITGAAVGLAGVAGAVPVQAQPVETPPASYRATAALDLERGSLRVDWSLDFVAQESDTVAFLLNRGLALSDRTGGAVRGFAVAPWDEGSDWNRIAVALDPAIEPGDTVRVEFEYAGVPVWPANGMNAISESWVELNVDSAWHPVFETFDRLLVGVLRVDLPADWTIASSGAVERQDGGWRIRDETPQIDVAFAASPTWRTLASSRFRVSHPGGQDSTSLRRLLETAEGCADRLNARFGQRDSLSHGWFVIAPRQESGYARGNYIVLTDLRDSSEVNLTGFVCHELAHTWATGAAPMSPDNWLNEGFAQYLAAEFVREWHGEEAFQRLLEEWAADLGDQPPVWTSETRERPGFQVAYRKAPLVLHRLQTRMGERNFERLLREFLVDRSLDTTPELLELVESIGGRETRVWLEEELAR